MKLPSVFIASSVEGLEIARALQSGLNYVAEPECWDQGTFDLGVTSIESLEKKCRDVDFAVFVIRPDDMAVKRGATAAVPRDNVVFEMGLFAGSLGRERCFMVWDEAEKIELPSDLLGVTPAKYRLHQSANLEASLGTTCTKITKAIRRLGLRPRVDGESLAALNELNAFRSRLEGKWWELLIVGGKVSGLSFFIIEPDPTTNGVKVADARAFDLEGNLDSNWASLASCIKADDRKVFYYWDGGPVARPHEPYQGFGEMQFNDAPDAAPFTRGKGSFSNTSLVDLTSTLMKVTELRRATEKEEKDMREGDSKTIRALIKDKLQSW
jgi:hypothetical protein